MPSISTQLHMYWNSCWKISDSNTLKGGTRICKIKPLEVIRVMISAVLIHSSQFSRPSYLLYLISAVPHKAIIISISPSQLMHSITQINLQVCQHRPRVRQCTQAVLLQGYARRNGVSTDVMLEAKIWGLSAAFLVARRVCKKHSLSCKVALQIMSTECRSYTYSLIWTAFGVLPWHLSKVLDQKRNHNVRVIYVSQCVLVRKMHHNPVSTLLCQDRLLNLRTMAKNSLK